MIYPKYNIIYQICFLQPHEYTHSNILFNSVNKNFLQMCRIVLNNASDWDNTMDIIISKVKTNNEIPILHIDTHGCFYGYGICANNYISWPKLISKISELNKTSNNNLFLSLNVCHGLYLSNFLFGNPKPENLCKNCIGSYDLVVAHEATNRFMAMYSEYQSTYCMNDAIQRFMNLNTQKKNVFRLLNSC